MKSRYLLASLACAAIFFAYALIGAALGWKHGGGVFPMMLLLAALGATWKAITGRRPSDPLFPSKEATETPSQSLTNEARNDPAAPRPVTRDLQLSTNEPLPSKDVSPGKSESPNKKQRLGMAFLSVAFLLLALGIAIDTPFRGAGDFVGTLLVRIVVWTLILGLISCAIWRLALKKREGLFLFTFSILFLAASLFEIVVGLYVAQKKSEIAELLAGRVERVQSVSPTTVELRELSVRVDFPPDYPVPEFVDASRERSGRLIKAGLYKTSNLKGGTISFDGPGIKQFMFGFMECPVDLGCTLEREVSDLVLRQELNGGKVFRNERIREG